MQKCNKRNGIFFKMIVSSRKINFNWKVLMILNDNKNRRNKYKTLNNYNEFFHWKRKDFLCWHKVCFVFFFPNYTLPYSHKCTRNAAYIMMEQIFYKYILHSGAYNTLKLRLKVFCDRSQHHTSIKNKVKLQLS